MNHRSDTPEVVVSDDHSEIARVRAQATARDRARLDAALTDLDSLAFPAELVMSMSRSLFHRIKWDAQFARGEFALGYYDRILHQEKAVPFTRAVYKDGDVIWQRPGHPQS